MDHWSAEEGEAGGAFYFDGENFTTHALSFSIEDDDLVLAGSAGHSVGVFL